MIREIKISDVRKIDGQYSFVVSRTDIPGNFFTCRATKERLISECARMSAIERWGWGNDTVKILPFDPAA